jgi:integrase
MKQRYNYYPRENGVYYSFDTLTKKRRTLNTSDPDEAQRLVNALNEACKQPAVNLQIAQVYLEHSNPDLAKRNWQHVMDEMGRNKSGSTKERWDTAVKDKAFDQIRFLVLIKTQAEHLLDAMHKGTVSTNVFLRRIHNFALDMNWLPRSIVPKRQWPKVKYGTKRAITFEEHFKILEREKNPERKAFYQLAWHFGASQSDLANLQAEDVDWQTRIICFERGKLRGRNLTPPQIRIGQEVEAILATLPKTGLLFPYLATVRASDRATEFKQRCAGLGIKGVTLHSYRYAWAERAKTAGYPERWAQVNLGHNSKAWARAYSKNAPVILPPLEEYERKIVQLPTLRRPETVAETQGVNA